MTLLEKTLIFMGIAAALFGIVYSIWYLLIAKNDRWRSRNAAIALSLMLVLYFGFITWNRYAVTKARLALDDRQITELQRLKSEIQNNMAQLETKLKSAQNQYSALKQEYEEVRDRLPTAARSDLKRYRQELQEGMLGVKQTSGTAKIEMTALRQNFVHGLVAPADTLLSLTDRITSRNVIDFLTHDLYVGEIRQQVRQLHEVLKLVLTELDNIEHQLGILENELNLLVKDMELTLQFRFDKELLSAIDWY